MNKARNLLKIFEAEGTTFEGKRDRDTILADYKVGEEIPVEEINKEFGRSFAKTFRIEYGFVGIDHFGVVEIAVWSRSISQWVVIQLSKKDLSVLKKLI